MATFPGSDHGWASYWSRGAEDIQDALRPPDPAPGRVRTIEDLTEKEIREIEQAHGCKVIRPLRSTDSGHD